MPEKCPHCGEKLPLIQDAFCPECHEALDDTPVRPEPISPAEQERNRAASRVNTRIVLAVLLVLMSLLWFVIRPSYEGGILLFVALAMLAMALDKDFYSRNKKSPSDDAK